MMHVNAFDEDPQANTKNSPSGEYDGIPNCVIWLDMNFTLQPLIGSVSSVGDVVSVADFIVGIDGCGITVQVGGNGGTDMRVGGEEVT
jgi:hypothetical protein